MRFDQPRRLRQSMSWLHTWSGLLLGWLLFAIFVTGTLSFFRSEITLWMQPELHQARQDENALQHAQSVLEREAASSPTWYISLPGPRSPTLGLMWQEKTARSGNNTAQNRAAQNSGDNDARPRGMQRQEGSRAEGGENTGPAPAHNASGAPAAQQQRHGRQNMKQLVVDPASGEILKPRETAGGNFLYRFHFELHGIDRLWGRWIVGIATMFMLIAIISGVIVHRNIFKDFFTFRPGKGKRSWLDAHNATSVLSLPFHFVITFSGLLLLAGILMPTAINKAYDGDTRAFAQELRGRNFAEPEPPSRQPAPLATLSSLVAEAGRQWPGQKIGSITVTNPGRSNARIEMRLSHGQSLANRGATERMIFNGVSGEMLETPAAASPSAILSTWNAMSALHLGRFASPVPRWLLFLAGIGGCVMVASGMAMWVLARLKDRKTPDRIPFGHRLVEILNVAGIAGLLVAIAAYFWANRLLPADLAGRNNWEIRIFFIVWLLSAVHALLRRHKAAWVEQLGVAGLLTLTLPLLNTVTGGMHLGSSLMAGQWQIAGFDLSALAIGAMLLFAAYKVRVHSPRSRTHSAHKQTAHAEAPEPPKTSAAAQQPPLQPLFANLQAEETS